MAEKKSSNLWKCVFSTPFHRQHINPQVQEAWLRLRGSYPKRAKSAPFGALQKIWRDDHCRVLNHWGSDECPYDEVDCSVAYLRVVKASFGGKNQLGQFSVLAGESALDRLENKPLERDRPHPYNRTDGPQGPRDPGDAGDDPEARRELRRIFGGPARVGEVLRTLNDRARQRESEDGKESAKR